MNKRLLVLNGLSILAVIANHATLSGYIAMFFWTDRYWNVSVPNYDQMGSFGYYLLVAVQKLALFCVPAFLFVTGVFLTYMARGSQSRLTLGVVWRRVLNFIPPYLIWIGLYFLAEFVLGKVYTPVQYVSQIIFVNRSPLFFVPLVIVYYLLSPVLAPLAQKRGAVLLAVSGLILAGGVAHSYITLANFGKENPLESIYRWVLPDGPLFEYFFYFALGMLVGFHNARVKPLLVRFRWVLLGFTLGFGLLAVVESELVYQATQSIFWRSRTLTLPTVLYSITFILSFMAFDSVRLPFENQLFKLGGSTLGVYLIHQIPLIYIPKIIYHVFPAILAYQVLYQPLLVSLALAAPLILMELVRRTPIKPAYRILFG